MLTSTTFQSDVLRLLNTLKQKKQRIEERCAQELAAVDREIEAVNTTARLMRGDTVNAASEPQDNFPQVEITSVPMSELMGKTAKHALIEIAKRNNGLVHVGSAKKMLVDARVVKPTKYAWGAVYTTLSRSPEFQKVPEAAATFRLLGQDSQALLQ